MAQEFKCSKCGHEWKSKLGYMRRVGGPRKPKACPRCKRYDWEESTVISSAQSTDSKAADEWAEARRVIKLAKGESR